MSENAVHTPGAIRAARAICEKLSEKLCQTMAIKLDRAAVFGLAEIIDRQTAAPKLLEACEDGLRELRWAEEHLRKQKLGSVSNAIETIRAAIAEAKKEQ